MSPSRCPPPPSHNQTWDIEGSPSARAVPAILEVSPPLLLASQPEQLRVTGLNMLQNDCQLLLRLQGRYVQPAAAHCGDCCCAASVHPASGAGPAGQLAAAAAASSFEQRCCGCCTDKLQLVGLLPRPFPAATDAAVSAGAPGGAAAIEPPSCCQARTPAGAAAPDAAPPCCQAQQATTQQQPEQQQQAAVGSAGRRLLAGAARMQSLRLQLPSQAQQEAAGQQALPPGLLHLDIARRAYMAPRGAHEPRACHCMLGRPACAAPAGGTLCSARELAPLPQCSAGRARAAFALLFTQCRVPLLAAGARVLVVSSPAVHRELVLLLRTQGPTALPPPLLDQAREALLRRGSWPALHRSAACAGGAAGALSAEAPAMAAAEPADGPAPPAARPLTAHPIPLHCAPCLPVQLGVVMEWLGQPAKMQYQLVEATAARYLPPAASRAPMGAWAGAAQESLHLSV